MNNKNLNYETTKQIHNFIVTNKLEENKKQHKVFQFNRPFNALLNLSALCLNSNN